MVRYVIADDKVHHILRELVEWDAALTWCGQRLPPRIVNEMKGRDCLRCGDEWVKAKREGAK